MPLVSGTRLGPYEVVGPLGVGGMGEVYRARDTRLDRTVAIKILPAHLSSDPVRKQRFEREAKTISSLNHPHVCTLHDIGSQDGIDYLVMECVEGETLAKRLERGPLPLEQVLKYGAQIADALDKAHCSGVVHRDLKPGNIMLTSTGAKLLDFGLAKPASALGAAATLSVSAKDSPVTEQGTIVGTFQYMSPEQVEGKELDGRSDIFSLGAVLYEMVTGRRAFAGKSQLSVASAILEKEPEPISASKPMTPPVLDHVVRKCLAKVADERWQSARDLASELKWVAKSGASNVGGRTTKGVTKREWLMGAAAVVVLAFTIAGAFWITALKRQLALKSQLVESSLTPADNFSYPSLPQIALSPDGRRLAFIAIGGQGKRGLWLRDLDSQAAREIADVENAMYPFWSPDSHYVGFFEDGKLKKLDAGGGPSQVVADAPNGRGGTWNSGGIIVFAPSTGTSLFRVPAGGGEVKEVAKLDRNTGFNSFRFPAFLPDGQHYVFLARGNPDMVKLGSLDASEAKALLPGSNAAYAAGYLLLVRQNTLMAQRFDSDSLQLAGDAVPLASGIAFDTLNHRGCFTVAGDGSLIYQSGRGVFPRMLRVVDRSGKDIINNLFQGSTDAVPMHARFSPDGQRIAAQRFDPTKGSNDIWIEEPARNLRTRFTFERSFQGSPVWSPDGSQIAFSSNPKGRSDLYVKPANLSQPQQPLLVTDVDKTPNDWSRDGKFLLYGNTSARGIVASTIVTAGPAGELWALPLTGERKPFLFLSLSAGAVSRARFSPDGRWVAYQSNASGSSQVYITSFPDHSGVWQVSTEGGGEPAWGMGGKELFFVNQEKVWVSEISQERGVPKPGPPRSLFEIRGGLAEVTDRFDVTADGNKFLLITNIETTTSQPLTLVTNWTARLNK